MKTIFKVILITSLISINHHTSGQSQTASKKITAFEFMIGEWQGTSTHFSQQGAQLSDVSESVSYALDSTVLIIRGTGIDHNGVKQHDALGVLYFENGGYHMHAFTMQGQNVIADVIITGDKTIDWGFDLPNGGKIKYTASFSESSWEESGSYTTPDGSETFPTIKMNLSRK